MKKSQRIFQLLSLLFIIFCYLNNRTPLAYSTANDCQLEPSSDNYIGVKYKALLAEDKLPKTNWVLLFGGNSFTRDGEYQPHFLNLMIKAGWVNLFDDGLCTPGLYFPFREIRDNFTIGMGIDDYEDESFQDNDIGVWTRDPTLLPRYFSNIDSNNINAPDFTAVEYQVDKGGTLEGRELEVSLIRAEVTRLAQDKNYFIDPDNGCKPNSQADILYRHWIANLKVPSLGVNCTADFYINADQGDKICGANTLNFIWENPDRTQFETDQYKVILYDMQVQTMSGEWKPATKFLADYRTPLNHLPINEKGELVGGYRKVNYKGIPALEASFGYGYTDYVKDGDLTDYEHSLSTKAVIDLQQPIGTESCDLNITLKDASKNSVSYALIYLDDVFMGVTDQHGNYLLSGIYSGYHSLYVLKPSFFNITNLIYLNPHEAANINILSNATYIDYKNEYDHLNGIFIDLNNNYKSLQEKYSLLKNDYNLLITNNSKLYHEIDSFKSQINSLQNDNVNLHSQIAILQNDLSLINSQNRLDLVIKFSLAGLSVLLFLTTLFFYLRSRR